MADEYSSLADKDKAFDISKISIIIKEGKNNFLTVLLIKLSNNYTASLIDFENIS